MFMRGYGAVVVGVGRSVHIILGPLEEIACSDGVGFVVAEFVSLEGVTCGDLEESVCLLTHQ